MGRLAENLGGGKSKATELCPSECGKVTMENKYNGWLLQEQLED